jgi:hypothetical protein
MDGPCVSAAVARGESTEYSIPLTGQGEALFFPVDRVVYPCSDDFFNEELDREGGGGGIDFARLGPNGSPVGYLRGLQERLMVWEQCEQ